MLIFTLKRVFMHALSKEYNMIRNILLCSKTYFSCFQIIFTELFKKIHICGQLDIYCNKRKKKKDRRATEESMNEYVRACVYFVNI